MKKILAILLALVMVFALAGCSSTDYTEQLDGIADSLESVQDTLETLIAAEEAAVEEAEEVAESTYSGELIVFAAASMTETLTEIGDLFMEANPDVEIVFNFDSSGTLKTQIEEGADCDVFISAGQKQMDQLDITADESVNTDGLDFVISETRFDILENKVTLAVPEGNPAGIESFDQLAELLAAGDVFLAMGNEDVPVGQYTQLILEYYGLDEEELASNGCITYGSNVKEVTTQVSEATVDCGIIYATDAYSAGLTVVDSATAEMCGQVIYPAAVLNITSNQELAEAFLEFCTSDEASAILESVGFTPLA
ncbi:MAG: molybdate ABC transporter substrate-binding protein [Oscillospiraceae bacterium]|nr:molybdate ABC transporter substrate-binding protein [Oscillospiraceae bacterium]